MYLYTNISYYDETKNENWWCCYKTQQKQQTNLHCHSFWWCHKYTRGVSKRHMWVLTNTLTHTHTNSIRHTNTHTYTHIKKRICVKWNPKNEKENCLFYKQKKLKKQKNTTKFAPPPSLPPAVLRFKKNVFVFVAGFPKFKPQNELWILVV